MSVSVELSSTQLLIHSAMGLQLSFEKVLSLTKWSVYLACTWPPSNSATKWQIIRYNTRWCMSFINVSWIFLGLVFSIYKHREDFRVVTQSACFAGSTVYLMIVMIGYRIQLKPTQARIEEMEDFLKTARPDERSVLRRYAKKFSILHIAIGVITYLVGSMVTFAPLLLHHQQFPTMAVYPFSVDSDVVRSFAFIQQGIVAYQCSSGVGAICQATVMMWFAGARLELLAAETESLLKTRGCPDFVEKHKNLLAYAVDVSKGMRYVALGSSAAGGLEAIMSSLLFLSDQPLVEKMQFALHAIVSGGNLFMCAWPADNLMNMCNSLGNAVYNIAWYDLPVSTRKNLLMIIQRSQRPIIVSVGGLLPTVSLRSYAAFLAAVYSYITALRAMTSD